MHTVDIYIETSLKGPNRGDGRAVYVVAGERNVMRHGQQHKELKTAQGIISLENTTENQLTVKALEETLKRFFKPGKIRLYVESNHVYTVLRSGWLEKWRYGNWMTKNGKPVTDADIWKEVEERIKFHEVEVHLKEQHSFKLWMQETLKRGKIDLPPERSTR